MEVRVPTISYAITVCNEEKEIKELLSFILKYKREEDEVVVLVDLNKTTSSVLGYLHRLSSDNYILFKEEYFKNHFANWKNLLTSCCTKDFIFQIDADEIPHKELIDTLPFLLGMNEDIDVMLVPRVNTVEGLTQDHIAKWKWSVNEKEWINWPDYQWRIYRNNPNVKWINKVHERLDGFKQYATLPMEEEFALYHPKTIERQEKQNAYYNTL